MPGLEGDVVFAEKQKRFRPIMPPSAPNPIGSKPKILSNPEISMPGPLHCFSADSLDALQQYSDMVKLKQSTIEIVHDTHTGYILRDPDSELAAQRCFVAVRNLRATNRIDIDSMQAKSTGICRAKVQRDLGNKSECLHECLPTAGCREVIYFLTSATMNFLLLIFLVPMTGMVRLLSRSSNKRCRTLVSGSGGTMSLPLQDLKTGTFYRPECARAPPNNAHRSFPALHLRMIACS